MTAAEIKDLYAGLQKSHLIDFDVLLSGYAPGSQAVEAVGEIAKDLKTQNEKCARPLFWGKCFAGSFSMGMRYGR